MKPARMGWIYFVQEQPDGNVKIGWSTRPRRRIERMATSNSRELKLVGLRRGTQGDERALHRRFQSHRLRGEWFAPALELLEYARSDPRRRPFLGLNRQGLVGDHPHMGDRVDGGEVFAAAAWLRRFRKRRRPSTRGTTRDLVDHLQAETGAIVTNGAMVLAAYVLGYPLEQVAPGSPDCYVGVEADAFRLKGERKR